jgi:acyl-CoA synthetase (AMP-forming)/AMP-acid ligase II
VGGTFQIADLFESIAEAIPDRVALVSGSTRLTFAALDERADRLAGMLRERGVKPGDHVGLHLYNGHEFVEAMLALFKLRAVPINLNYRYVEAELRQLCADADLVGALSEPDLPALPVPWTLQSGYDLSDAPRFRDYGARSGDDLYIIYTGGTTGKPKGVMWRQEDLFFAGLQGGRPGGDPVERPEEVVEHARDPDNAMLMLPAAPFIHGAAQLGGWICLFTGGKLVLQPGRSFDAVRCAELIGEEQLTTITLVGDAMARPLAEALGAKPHETSSLIAIASAGAILSPTVRDRLQELLPDTLILNNFGSTETGHNGTAYDGDRSFAMGPDTVVLDGQLARGGRIPLGYYKDAAKTAERFVEIDGRRFVLTGDAAVVEEDGRITVLGRGSNCINTGGEKVFPEEVEEALKAHPDVFDALVVGVADERWMQRVAAVVQPRPGRTPTLEELQAHCRTLIAGYKMPRQVALVDEVSRYPSGKPDYAWARSVLT